ncbi:MAG: Holliday junction resolvase RuvX [Candidatus Aminicenantes bacterium]|nr:Holliday junction resolvase RuvX [Candidatus Aminicenantes bacterium]
MRILGIDYGDKTIGLAVSDEMLITAQALQSYKVKNKDEDIRFFKDLASKYKINKIVIGLPLRMDGSEGSRVKKTKHFASWLKKSLDIPVVYWDERLTTKQALRIMKGNRLSNKKKKELVDQISAVLILSSYLNSL